MPEYVLRNIDPQLWSRFTERANREGWPTKALFVSLMDSYANGDIKLRTPPPKELPEFAWLRAHYREIAKQPGFDDIHPQQQWHILVDHVCKSPAGLSWEKVEVVPKQRRVEVLDWLRRTSNLPIRHVLTLRATLHIGHGPDLMTNRRAIQYEVLGLPRNQQALIGDYDGGWRILRVVDDQLRTWGEPHLTKDDALDSLAREVEQEKTAIP